MSLGDTVRGAVSRAPVAAGGAIGIGQDDIIFAMVAFAFVVWITTKGELPTYLAFFKPGATEGPTPVPVAASSTTGAATPASNIPGVSTVVNGINTAVNGTGIGKAITSVLGTPLTVNTTGGGIIGGIGSAFTSAKTFLGGLF
jgi:hypothetical protein